MSGERAFAIEIDDSSGGLRVDGQAVTADLSQVTPSLYSLLMDGRSYELFVEEEHGEYCIVIGGELYPLRVFSDREGRLAKARGKEARPGGETHVKAPMPGLVVGVEVAPGDAIQARQGLVILEAMKMENEIRAPNAGTVRAVHVVKGQKVDQGAVLVVIG